MIVSEIAADTVVAISAMKMPNRGPNNTPELSVRSVRGMGNWVINTYNTVNITGKIGPSSFDQYRNC